MSEEAFRWVMSAGVVLICIAFTVQSVVFLAIYRAGKEIQPGQALKEAKGKLEPVVEQIGSVFTDIGKLLDENRPGLVAITAETLAIAKEARRQVERISAVVDDANERAHTRIAQIDSAVDHTVAQIENVSDSVKTAVLRPVREVNGVVAGVKAAVTAYAQGGRGRRHSVEHATQDEEMFI